jgi:peptidyl-prolyl cis-trans isomerase B (cyclophilin B)
VATKKERQRKLARDRHHRRLQRQAARDRRTRQLTAALLAALLVVGVGVGSAAAAGVFNTTKGKPTAGSTPSATPTPTPTPAPSATPGTVAGKCVYTKAGKAARKVKLPSAKPDTTATYQATIATNRGDIVIDLNNNAAPCTVNSFVSLADQGFFNNTHCHRLSTVDPYVLQCGDPTGTGEGGPGYKFANEINSSQGTDGYVTYLPGTVGMANSDEPDTNGSQFFLVYKSSLLQPDYTPFGTIVSGLNIIQNVAKAGSDNSDGQGDGHPKEKVEINSVTIKKT